MSKCPTSQELAGFADGSLQKQEAISIRRHVVSCRACAQVIKDLLETQALGQEGLLVALSAQEQDQAQQLIRDKMHPQKNKSPKTRLETVLTAATAGLAETSMKGVRENFFPEAVRNHGLLGSTSVNDPENTTNGREEMMNNLANDAPKAWGLPPIDATSPLVQQGYDDTCAIRSQQLILQDFGINVTEDELVALAGEQGWYDQGTPQDCVGNILDYYGVETQRFYDANIFSLTSELAQGHRVIIAVDSGELWSPGWGEKFSDFFGPAPDHALIVAGIDTTDPDNVTVQLMDPGTGEIAAGYPLVQFMDAWEDSGFQMVSTVEPPPPFAFGMSGFDFTENLHIPFVGELPYGEFDRFYSYASQQASEASLWETFSDNFLACIKGEISIPQLLTGMFENDVPQPQDIPFTEAMNNELVKFGGASDYFDQAAQSDSWANYYTDLSGMYASAGDPSTASWYADQAASAADDASWYNSQGMDSLGE